MKTEQTELERPLAIDLAKDIFGKNWESFDKDKQGQIINLIYEFAIKHQEALQKQMSLTLENIKALADEGLNKF